MTAAATFLKNLDAVVASERQLVNRIGLDGTYLDAPLILPLSEAMKIERQLTLREWLSMILAQGNFVDVHAVTAFNGTRKGIALKGSGSPTTNLLFRLDGGELYLAGGGKGDTVLEWDDDEAAKEGVSLTLLTIPMIEKLSGRS